MPSVSDLLFLALLFLLSTGILSQKLLGDAGTGWHIRAGEQILATHAIPRYDVFSVSTAGIRWYAWEWLYDAAIAAVHHVAGLNGVVFVTALVIGLTFAVAFRMMMRHGAELPVSLVLVLLAIGASTIHFLARPHVFSWLLVLIWFELLDRSSETGNVRLLYWLPPITLVWVNLHGGFLVGFVLAILFMAGKTIEYWRNPGDRNNIASFLKSLAAVTGVSFLVTFINPYGYNLHVHIYHYLGDRFLMNHVEEFQSPNFHGVAQQCFAALVLISIATLALAHKKLNASHLLVVVFAVYSGMYATRNLPASSILLVLIMAPVLSFVFAEFGETPVPIRRFAIRFQGFSERMSSVESRFRGHLWPILGVAVLTAACGHQGRLGSQKVMDAHFSEKRFPVTAVNYVQQQDPGVPIFIPDYWGGYFIYRLYPQNRVFVDDRHDLYGDDFFKKYLRVIHVVPGWQKVFHDMRVNIAVLPTESSLTNILRETHQWKVEYEDETAVVFRRAEP